MHSFFLVTPGVRRPKGGDQLLEDAAEGEGGTHLATGTRKPTVQRATEIIRTTG